MSRTLPAAGGQPAGVADKPAHTILVPLDGTTHSASALPVARTLAELESATLHIVHVAARPLTPGELVERLQLAQAQVRGAVVNPLTGPPATAIVRQAQACHALFIVMCAHTGAEQPAGALGRVARAVIASAHCPVVLVPPARGDRPWVLRRLVLPHDGTPASAAALGPAADLAQRAAAELDVLHVAGPEAVPAEEPGTLRVPRYVDQPQHEWPAWAQEFLDRLRGLGHRPEAVHLRLNLAVGEPASAIVRFAADHHADLVVLAWRGRLDPDRARTLRTVLSAAPCPVLIVRVAA